LLKLLIVIDYPVDLISLLMTMIETVFIDHKQENNKGNGKGNGEPKGIDNGVKLISPQKPEGCFDVVFEHTLGASYCQL